MASKFYRQGGTQSYLKAKTNEMTKYLVTHVYAAFACELWDMGWEADQIEELFARTQARWNDSTQHGWDILANVREVTGLDIDYVVNDKKGR